ncbi:MAG: SPASM domain-containing protein, partial [bacterium]
MLQGKGEFFPCCYMTNHRVGTLDEGSLRDLRQRPFMTELRQSHFRGTLPGPCAKCPQLVPYNRRQLLKEGLAEVRTALRRARTDRGRQTPEQQESPLGETNARK